MTGKRRPSKDGSIVKLPSGSWRAQIRMGQGKRITKTFPTQQAARNWIKETNEQVEQGLTYQATQTMLGTYLDSWLETKKKSVRVATAEQYEWVSRMYIRPRLGRVKVNEITPAMVQKLCDTLLEEKVGVRTIQIVHAVLRGCLKQAVRIGLAVRNSADFVIVPKSQTREMTIWTESQVNQFLMAIRGHRNEILFVFALGTGMRKAELLGLKWSDVDWSASTLAVQRQAIEKTGGGFIFQEPKTKRGRRSIQLGPGLLERLREQMKRLDVLRKTSGSWHENDLIFPTTLGTPQCQSNVYHDFQHLSALAGLPIIRFHDCRHTAASIMLSRGIPPIIVAGMLGHSLAVLMDRYAHFIPNTQGDAARLMDEVTTLVDVSRKG